MTVDDATDVLWFYFGHSAFFTLMDDNGWSADRSKSGFERCRRSPFSARTAGR